MRKHSSSGAALFLVLWVIAILSFTVLGLVDFVRIDLDEGTDVAKRDRARDLALSGMAWGSHPLVKNYDSHLSQRPASDESFAVQFSSEGGRLPINMLLAQDQRVILSRLFTDWGMPAERIDSLIDCLEDWIDPSPFRRLNGAKAEDYARAGLPQRPRLAPFLSVEEMGQVMGMDYLNSIYPAWKDAFTVWSDGKLDLNAAPAELVYAVLGGTPGQAEALVRRRVGADGIANTSDDVLYGSLNEAIAVMNLTPAQIQVANAWCSVSDGGRRVVSVGTAHGVSYKIVAVVQLGSAPIQYRAWMEP